MEREGLLVDTQTLWDQIHALSRHLEPSYEALHRYVLSAPVFGADETSWRLMGQTNAAKSWWVWAVARPDAVVYRILPSRSAEAAKEVLRDFSGIVMADGLGSYGRLRRERDGPPFRLVACWAVVAGAAEATRRDELGELSLAPRAGLVGLSDPSLHALEPGARLVVDPPRLPRPPNRPRRCSR